MQSKISKFFASSSSSSKPKSASTPIPSQSTAPSSSSSSSLKPKSPQILETIDLCDDNTEVNQTSSVSEVSIQQGSHSILEREFTEDPVKRRKLLHVLQSSKGEDEGEPWYNKAQESSEGAQPISVGSSGKVNYTPLEKQVVSIRQQYADCLLMVECGYRMRFFGADAIAAAKVLSIYAHQDHNFMVASVPTHRAFIHCQRLLTAGHKVAIVRQTETAAIRKGNKVSSGSTFERSVAGVFTEGTIIDSDDPAFDGICKDAQTAISEDQGEESGGEEMEDSMEKQETSDDNIEEDIWIAAVIEDQENIGSSSIAVVALNIKAHKLWVAQVPNDALRQSLQDQLDVLKPAEILLSENASLTTKRCIQDRSFVQASVSNTIIRNYVKRIKFYPASAFVNSVENSLKGNLQWWIDMSPLCKLGINALFTYLSEFGLKAALTNPILLQSECIDDKKEELKQSFALDGITIRDLEIFDTLSNATKQMRQLGKLMKQTHLGKKYDGLFALLDKCRTVYGRRTLKQWIMHPLANVLSINSRLDGIEWTIRSTRHSVDSNCYHAIVHMCTSYPDVEKMIASLQHNRISFIRLVKLLQMGDKMSILEFPREVQQAMPGLLQDWISSVDIQFITNTSRKYLAKLQLGFSEDSISGLFTPETESEYPDLVQLKQHKSQIEANLEAELQSIRKILKKPTLQYSILRSGPISQVEHLIELPIQEEKSVPSDWIKVSSTKQVVRFHTQKILSLQGELYKARDEAKIAAQVAWKSFIAEVSECLSLALRQTVQVLGNFDALFSLAAVAQLPNYVRPIYTESEQHEIIIRNARHPTLERIMELQGHDFLPNDVRLGSNHGSRCCQVITGPNMGGKSSYVRMVATICLMGQIGSYVPAEYASLQIFDNIFTRMGAEDDLSSGKSTFMCELIRTNSILKKSTAKSLVIIDELGRGTSTNDGQAIAIATLEYIINQLGCTTLFITHYHQISKMVELGKFGTKCFNSHMGYIENEGDQGEKDVIFLYKLVEEAAKGSHGINVARLAGISKDVLDRAMEMSIWMSNKSSTISMT